MRRHRDAPGRSLGPSYVIVAAVTAIGGGRRFTVRVRGGRRFTVYVDPHNLYGPDVIELVEAIVAVWPAHPPAGF